MANGGRKPLYNKSPVVKDDDFDEFVSRCLNELKRQKKTPTTTPLPLFGTRPINERTYLTRFRAFVKWLLQHKAYDSSLIMFYPYTPRGAAVVDARAVSIFMISAFTPLGQPVHGGAFKVSTIERFRVVEGTQDPSRNL